MKVVLTLDSSFSLSHQIMLSSGMWVFKMRCMSFLESFLDSSLGFSKEGEPECGRLRAVS